MSPELFLLDLSKWDVPPEVRTRIEKRLRDVLLDEISKLDFKGDLVMTPLSESKEWLSGLVHLAGQSDRLISGGSPQLHRRSSK
jgi:hypothetical protein